MDLSAFDNITVDNKGRISPNDRIFCEEQQRLFNHTFAQIRENQKALEKQLADNPNPAFEIRYHSPHVSDKYQYFNYHADFTEEKHYRTLEYTPLYALKACEKLYKDLCGHFEEQLVSHFNSTYGCQFEAKDRLYNKLFARFVQTDRYGYTKLEAPQDQLVLPTDDDQVPSYETIVDYIIAELGGKTFQEKQRELDLQAFTEEFSWNGIEASRNVVKIIHCIYYGSWNDCYKVKWENRTKIGIICRTIRTIFSLTIVPHFQDSDIYAGDEVSVYCGGGVLDSFKAFKNGNLQLTFRTAEQAKTFADTVNNLKPKSR